MNASKYEFIVLFVSGNETTWLSLSVISFFAFWVCLVVILASGILIWNNFIWQPDFYLHKILHHMVSSSILEVSLMALWLKLKAAADGKQMLLVESQRNQKFDSAVVAGSAVIHPSKCWLWYDHQMMLWISNQDYVDTNLHLTTILL